MVVTEAPAAERTPAHRRRNRPDYGRLLDHGLALALAGTVFLVHDVGYMLGQPFWVDEAWVADSTRAPLGLLPWITSSTPLGWTLLLRVVPGNGSQDLRLLPLFFTALATLLAYHFGRALPLPRYVGGLLTGSAVLLVPAMLEQDDLKQYTAEACVSVGLLLLVARLERRWSRRALLGVVLLAAGGLFFSNSSAFVGAAVLVALLIASAIHRNLRRLLEVGVALAGTVVLSAAVYLAVDRRHTIAALTSYWDGYYLPRHHGVAGAFDFLHLHATALAPFLGSKYVALVVGLALLGFLGLVWLRRYAVALTVPLTIAFTLAASADDKYPFGDLRTSMFWIVQVTLLMAVGIACVIKVIARWNRTVAAVALALVAVAGLLAVHPYLRTRPLPDENVRDPVAYLNRHRQPGDIVIVSFGASWGFAYYDRQVEPGFRHTSAAATGFLPAYPRVPWLMQLPNRKPTTIATALARADFEIHAEGSSPPGRIWIVRSHMTPAEALAWQDDLAGNQVTTIPVGSDPLLLDQPS